MPDISPYLQALCNHHGLSGALPGLLAERGKYRTVDRYELLLQEDHPPRRLCFLASGECRSFYTDEEGHHITLAFAAPPETLNLSEPILRSHAAFENIQMTCRGIVFEFSREDLLWIKERDNGYAELNRKLIASYLDRLLLRMRCTDPRSDYRLRLERFKEAHPGLIGSIPQGHLASYLCMSRRHLNKLIQEVL